MCGEPLFIFLIAQFLVTISHRRSSHTMEDDNESSSEYSEAYDESEYLATEEDEECFTRWTHLPTPGVTDISIESDESVDAFLLKIAQVEMSMVADNVTGDLRGKPANASSILNVFMRKLVPLLADIIGRCDQDGDRDNEAPGADCVSELEVVEFIKCLCLLSVYRTTPTNFFDGDLEWLYPVAADRSQPIFSRCMRGLGQHPTSGSEGPGSRMSWRAPFEEDQCIRQVERATAELMSKLCFVRDKSILSIDNDQYRLSSKKADEIGLVRVNIPK